MKPFSVGCDDAGVPLEAHVGELKRPASSRYRRQDEIAVALAVVGSSGRRRAEARCHLA